jgi:DNA primase large subunit
VTDRRTCAIIGRIDINTIDSVAERSFPLCMKTMHQHFRAKHHLRHTARLQYGLFLKGLGITLEESLAYWRSELIQSVGSDKFDKEYAYNIRHNYGKEGRKVMYTPYSCVKIIHSDTVADEPHGCPFRSNTKQSLEQKLQQARVPRAAAEAVITAAAEHHYQVCAHTHTLSLCVTFRTSAFGER